MFYDRSLYIEKRLSLVLKLISTGKYSTPKLADEVGVSIPTISRCVTALRDRGYEISAKKRGAEWFYVLAKGQTRSLLVTDAAQDEIANQPVHSA